MRRIAGKKLSLYTSKINLKKIIKYYKIILITEEEIVELPDGLHLLIYRLRQAR